MTTSDQINELAVALAKAQAQVTGAMRDSANPFFKSKYADLESVWSACRKPLTDHGLSIVQSPSTEPQGDGIRVFVETLMLHASGQWIRGVVSVAAKEDSPQAVGSCISYLKRYALQSFAGVAPSDDDAEAAHGRGNSYTFARDAAQRQAAPKAPDGYDDWWTDMTAVADNGQDVLRKAWEGSPKQFRAYTSETKREAWEALKIRAHQRVGA